MLKKIRGLRSCVDRRSMVVVLLLGALIQISACGPTSYLYNVTYKASKAMESAKAAKSKDLAPYEYWSATTYLQMARETAPYAYFQNSIKYGKKAERMANLAVKLTEQRTKAPTAPDESSDDDDWDLDDKESSKRPAVKAQNKKSSLEDDEDDDNDI